MIRIAQLGDLHLTTGPRFDSTLAVLHRVVDDAIDHGVELWCVGGDCAGTVVPYRQPPAVKNALGDLFQLMGAVAPVILCRGNHDTDGDLDIFAHLESEHPIVVATGGIHTYTHADLGVPVVVHAVPYPHKRRYLALASGATIDEQLAVMNRLFMADLTAFVRDTPPTKGEVSVVVGHFNVSGALVGGGEVMSGHEIEVTTAFLDALDVTYVALSHLHKAQCMAPVRQHAWYAGSPSAQNFGEEEDPKCYLLVDLEPGEAPVVQRRLTGAPILLTVEATMTAKGLTRPWQLDQGDERLRDAEVRLRVDVPEELRGVASGAIDAMREELVAAGARLVQVDPRIIPTSRVRAPAIVAAASLAAKLDAWAAVQEPTLASDQLARLHARLAELEAS